MSINQTQRQTVLDELARCKSLKEACHIADIQDSSSILFLVKGDDSFASQYAAAREIGYALLGDKLRDTASDMTIPADHKRIMVDTDKWMLSKMLPKIYGDRLDLNHSGKVQTNQALTEAELLAIAAKGKGGDA